MIDVGEVLPAILLGDEAGEPALLEGGHVGPEVHAAVRRDPDRIGLVAHHTGVAGPEVGPVGGVAGGTGHRRGAAPGGEQRRERRGVGTAQRREATGDGAWEEFWIGWFWWT